ncbi:unnamed protein product [Urochloa humidicola]
MDPNQSNDGSQGGFPGGNIPPYQAGFNPYMLPYQLPPYLLQQLAPNVPMMHPTTSGPQVFPPAENASAPVQTQAIDVDEHPPVPPTGKGKRTKGGSRIKLSNFSAEEDVNLVTSYLEISEDAITNTGQKRDRFWERVLQRYNLRRGSFPERSWKSLQCRWELVKADVSKFASYHADAVRANPSGMSDADKTSLAAANYAGVEKTKFGYMHCWNIMKDSPIWQDPKLRSGANSAGIDLGAATINLEDDNSSPPAAAAGKRPMGRDACKAAKKKANSCTGSTSSSEYASRMQELSLQRIDILKEEAAKKNDRFQQLAFADEKRFEYLRTHNESLLQCEQEKIRIMREKHELEQQEKLRLMVENQKKEDERILGIDLDTCTPVLRKYYEYHQQQILAKIAGNNMQDQGPDEV